MSKPRFYCPDGLGAHQHVVLPDAIAHYALRVLRLRDGAEIVLFDGQGGEYPAHLHCEGKRATAMTSAHDPREAELAGHINLVQGLATADKMDWVIEKAVELGVHRVSPITAQRSVLQLRGERLEKRMQHWQRVVQSASEQCGRNRIMVVDRPRTLMEFLEQAITQPGSVTFLCHPEYGLPLEQALRNNADTLGNTASTSPAALNLLVGPEGGWSGPELALAHQHNITPIRFGPRILRTETAGLALIAASSALLGWNTGP